MKIEQNISRKSYFDRDGQSQKQRFPAALDPLFAKIDDRSLADLLNFAKEYAGELCFFDTSTNTSHDTWASFFDDIYPEQIASTLEDFGEHEPHLALYITFLKLFQHAQNHINTLTGRHLDFYYQNVLKLKKKEPIPDKAHVVFELKKDVDKQLIKAGTLFKAGKDNKGIELFYALTQDIVVNKANIKSLRSVFVDTENKDAVHIVPISNSSDGLGGKLDENDPKWPPFGNNTFPRAELGFALASPVLLLQEGQREISVYFTLSGIESNLTTGHEFIVYLTGEKGWIGPKNAKLTHVTESQYKLEITEGLKKDDGAVVNYNAEIHGNNFETSSPLIQVLLNNENENDDYSFLKNVVIKDVRIEVHVSEIQGLTLENDLGLLDAKKPFMPFGPNPIAGSNFYIGYQEAFTKNLQDFSLDIEWQNVPEEDLSNHYEAYKKDRFKLTKQSLENLKNEGIPDEILKALELLEDQEFTEEDKFWNAVEEYIGPDQPVEYKELILKYAKISIVGSKDYFKAELFAQDGSSWKDNFSKNLFYEENYSFHEDCSLKNSIKIVKPQGRARKVFVPPLFKVPEDKVHKLLQQRTTWAKNTLNHIQLTSQRGISMPSEPPLQESVSDTQVKRGYIRLRLIKSFLHEEYRELYVKTIVEYTKQEGADLALVLPNEPYTPVIQSLKLNYTAETDTIDLSSDSEDDFLRNEVEFFHITAFGQMREHAFQRSQLKFVPGKPYFKLTDHALSLLKRENIFADILADLKNLKDLTPQTEKEFLGKLKEFLDRLEKRFGQDQTARYKSLILEHARDKDIYLLPQYRNEGEFYIGITELKPLQNLPVFFQIAEGSANPEKRKVDVTWSMLCDNYWKVLDETHILSDTTNGLLTSGIIRFSIPAEATNTNTILPGRNYCWLKAEVESDSDAVCQLIDVRANAALVQFEDHQNDPEHLHTSLKAGSINNFIEQIATIKSVEQPYASFGGQMTEDDRSFYTRVSERLRHKERAITIWDYERMILQYFPAIYKAKCIGHRCPLSEFAPGHVTIIVIPDLKNKNAVNPFQPKVELNTLDEIKKFLDKYSGDFVQLFIENPSYEQIKVDFKVSFYKEFEFGYYRDLLNQEIQKFLSPWVFGEEQEMVFGGQVHKSVILNFIEERTYVDYITDLRMYHIISEDQVLQDTEMASASTPKTILVSSIDHKIEQA